MKKTTLPIMLALSLGISGASIANNMIITKSFTGGWFDPAKSGQGFLIEIISNSGEKRALASWYTFDNEGNQYWLTGVGDVEDQSIHFEMVLTEGGQFGDSHNPANITQSMWGDVTFTFSDCNNGTVTWEPVIAGFDSGSMPVIRNTNIYNSHCTGGLYDDLGDSITEFEIKTPLLSTGVEAGAYGEAEYEQRTDRVEFSVEVEDLPVGVYQLQVGDTVRGNISVVTESDGSTEGEIEFRDPVEPGKLPLDFDPQGQVIDVVQNEVIYLTSDDPMNSGGGNGSSTNAPPFGNSETEIYFVNNQIYPLGEAKAKLEQKPNRVEFEVELEDVPTGYYDFSVNNELKGAIHVVQSGNQLEGELEFSNPVEANKSLLDFNPFGQTLYISQGADVLFTVDFPQSSGGVNQNLDIELNFNNAGVNTAASGSVEYEIEGQRRELKVEVEDLAFGMYDLVVGGTTVVTIDVNSQEVEVEFSDPQEPGDMLLDFDPLNQLIEIKQSGTVYLSVVLQ